MQKKLEGGGGAGGACAAGGRVVRVSGGSHGGSGSGSAAAAHCTVLPRGGRRPQQVPLAGRSTAASEQTRVMGSEQLEGAA